ncbi:MAG TPA: DSD1 family PLP-dependent enzyme [Candidatus Deferrimicrobium sp.]|nr:DSD1 family PLP-dependent enzyme [Candidatus Deferrimicrobium sp.]
MSDTWKNEISTPALIVDYDILYKNIKYMAHFAEKSKIKLRPHVKTHKCPLIAHMQLEAGAQGICVAKISEAEVFAASGIKDILITNEIISPKKIQRLLNLNRYTKIMVCVDSKKNIEDLERFANKLNQKLEILIDLNVGLNRTGVAPGEPTLTLAKLIAQSPHLKLHGLQVYEGHLTYIKDFSQKEAQTHTCMKQAIETKELLLTNGIECETITAGGSGTYMITGKFPGITEIQPGTYVFNDHHIHSVVPELEIALTVLTTINNKPTKEIITLDMGSKSISNDMGNPLFKGYGTKIKIMALTEEHCQCTYSPKLDFNIGDKLEAIPAHVCPTVNLYDFFYVIKNGELIGKWQISARGMRE